MLIPKNPEKKQSIKKTGKSLSENHKLLIINGMKNSEKFKEVIHNPNRIKKSKETNLKKYGVENSAQNLEIFYKTQISGFKSKRYKETKIYYRGSYELNFLEKYYDRFSDLQNGPSIKYFNNGNKIYFPDFYIPSLNLIIECKNSYLLKKDSYIIDLKEKATVYNGFNYILIVDKDYLNFENFLKDKSI